MPPQHPSLVCVALTAWIFLHNVGVFLLPAAASSLTDSSNLLGDPWPAAPLTFELGKELGSVFRAKQEPKSQSSISGSARDSDCDFGQITSPSSASVFPVRPLWLLAFNYLASATGDLLN